MKKTMLSLAILAFAGATAFSTTNHQLNMSKSFVNSSMNDTTDTSKTPTKPSDTTSINLAYAVQDTVKDTTTTPTPTPTDTTSKVVLYK